MLIGGLAVTMRVSAAGAAHRSTVDIDLVTVDAEPEAVEVLADAHATPKQPLIIGEVKVDLIATSPITNEDLEGLDDQNRLFVAAHRWAFESGHPSRMTTTGSEPLDALVASTASLVATKCHAIGFPTSRRRATKRASDLLDLFRLVQLHNRDGELSRELRDRPAGLARIIADIALREAVASAPSATKQTASSLAPVRSCSSAAVMELLPSPRSWSHSRVKFTCVTNPRAILRFGQSLLGCQAPYSALPSNLSIYLVVSSDQPGGTDG